MLKKGWHYEEIKLNHPDERLPVPIIHDSAIAIKDICGGRLVPLLFLSTTEREDVKACFEAHRESRISGDVKTNWGREGSKKTGKIVLIIRFKTPAICNIILHFNIEIYGGLIDQIVETEAVWLTWGNAGDKFLDAQDRLKVFVEIESKGFKNEWDHILDEFLREQALEKGATKQESIIYSQKVREEWRKISKPF